MGGPPPYGQAPLAGLSPDSVNPFEGLAAQPFMGAGGHAGGDGAPDGALPSCSTPLVHRCTSLHHNPYQPRQRRSTCAPFARLAFLKQQKI